MLWILTAAARPERTADADAKRLSARVFDAGRVRGAEPMEPHDFLSAVSTIVPVAVLFAIEGGGGEGVWSAPVARWIAFVLDDHELSHEGVAARLQADGTTTFFTFSECVHEWRDATLGKARRKTCTKCGRTRAA